MTIERFRLLVEIAWGVKSLVEVYEFFEERRRRKREREAKPPSQIVECHHLTPLK